MNEPEIDNESLKSKKKFSKLKKIGQVKEEKRQERKIKIEKNKLYLKELEKKLGDEYFEREAELGSDNEENDHIKKNINKADNDENEDGQDEDLEELIDQSFDENYDNDNQFAADRMFVQDVLNESDNIMHLFRKKIDKFKQDQKDLENDELDQKKKLERIQELMKKLSEDNQSKFF